LMIGLFGDWPLLSSQHHDRGVKVVENNSSIGVGRVELERWWWFLTLELLFEHDSAVQLK
jgi:hypothetical protein